MADGICFNSIFAEEGLRKIEENVKMFVRNKSFFFFSFYFSCEQTK